MSGNLTEIQQLGLAFGALYSEIYGLKHDSLQGISAVDNEFQQYIYEIFKECWGIQTRDDLVQYLQWLYNYGSRRDYAEENEDCEADDILAWDLCLLIHNARFGCLAGLLSESEAWEWVVKGAAEMQEKFSSWHSFADNFRCGHRYWNALNVQNDERDEYDAAVDSLLDTENSGSPWNKIRLNAGGIKKGKKLVHQTFTPSQWATIADNKDIAAKDPLFK